MRAVADRDGFRGVLLEERAQCVLGLGERAFALHQVHGGVLEQLAGLVHHHALAPGTLARIDSEHVLLPERRREQELAQVLREHVDRALIALQLELHANVHFHGVHEQPLDAVTCRLAELLRERRLRRDPRVRLGERHDGLLVERELHPQDALALAAPDGEVAVGRDVRDRLVEVGVRVELRRFVGVLLYLADANRRLGHVEVARVLAHLGVFRHALGADVTSTGERRRDVGHLLFRADERERGLLGLAFERLRPEEIGERLESALLRDGRAGAALGLEREVKVFELGLGSDRPQLALELWRELALLLNLGEHRGASSLELDQVAAPLLDVPDLHLVEPRGRLLAVARDEGHGGALREQFDHGAHPGGREVELFGDRRNGIESRGFSGHRASSVSPN